jgi:hypothetical protein
MSVLKTLVASMMIGLACSMLNPSQPESVIATLLLISAMLISNWPNK